MSGTVTKTGTDAIEMVVSDQLSGFEKAKEIAAGNGGRLPTKGELIGWLGVPENYKQAAKDLLPGSNSNAFWVSDEAGPDFSGNARIDYEKGGLTSVSKEEWKLLPKEQRGYAIKDSRLEGTRKQDKAGLFGLLRSLKNKKQSGETSKEQPGVAIVVYREKYDVRLFCSTYWPGWPIRAAFVRVKGEENTEKAT